MFDGELSVLLGQTKVAQYTIGGRIKRIFDIIIASITLLVFSPLFAFVTILLKVTDPGPVIFRHMRVGQGGRHFACLKFRSMVPHSDQVLKVVLESDPAARMEWERTQKLASDPRITAAGKFLRQSSLDELPQLINVIRGDMSLAGPRPIVPSELTRYGDKLGLYLQARPGITGIWQVSGRNDCGYDRRIEVDANYVRNWRFSTDFVILLRTLGAVLARKGRRGSPRRRQPEAFARAHTASVPEKSSGRERLSVWNPTVSLPDDSCIGSFSLRTRVSQI